MGVDHDNMSKVPSRDEQRCEGYDCMESMKTSYCDDCNSFYCDICWPRQGPHRPGKVARDGLPHEKTDFEMVETLKSILSPPGDPKKLTELHRRDNDTTWFGVIDERRPIGLASEQVVKIESRLKDYGRFSTLMANSGSINGNNIRYPQLVSFIGETNAGKSTLIKMLITLFAKKPLSATKFPAPIVGSVRHDKVPTSADVHLYADPTSYQTALPLLFADCEGLNGGNKEPMAITSKKKSNPLGRRKKPTVDTLPGAGKVRDLAWAQDDVTRGREYVVTNLYPLLLYTFSDVVVFVMRNAKEFETRALKPLLDWGSRCLEASINAPTLPHAIIAFNATDLDVDPSEWNAELATENLMNLIADDIFKVPQFVDAAAAWKKKGKPVSNTKELILHYYASVTVVRIPVKGRYSKIQSQVTLLRDQIHKCCNESFYVKRKVRMLSNADELNTYLEAGLDHFSADLNKPFNFMDVNMKNNPIPQNWGDHVLNAAVAIKGSAKEGTEIFHALSPLLASSILLECVRQHRPGSIHDFFDKYYRGMCKTALENFCDVHWPCEYKDHKNRTCRNVRSLHSAKGHQNDEGKIFGPGSYQSTFSAETFFEQWMTLIKGHLSECEWNLQEKSRVFGARERTGYEERDAFEIQLRSLELFVAGRYENFFSLVTCYGCFMDVPQHPLPCGHALCSACIKSYGKTISDSSILLSNCPLHPATRFNPGWLVRFKPDFAGVRVLSLDGGGVRGILELEILNAIEASLGGEFQIQSFFDLIVGTSAGGIVALGLGAKQWSLRTCIQHFTETCDAAFTPRRLVGAKPFTKLITMTGAMSKYKSKSFEHVLKKKFQDQILFGGTQKDDLAYKTRVAVVTTSSTGSRSIIVTNYSRREDHTVQYDLEFSEGSRTGMKVWEAACATASAPTYFRPFRKLRTLKSYLDGALYYNNPIRIANTERRLLWPDVANLHPDIVLSIGTGKDLVEAHEDQKRGIDNKILAQKHKIFQDTNGNPNSPSGGGPYVYEHVKDWFKLLVTRMDKALDAESTWLEFYREVAGPQVDPQDRARYIRFNPLFKNGRPKLDAKASLKPLQEHISNELRSYDFPSLIQQVGHRLMASTFYFVKNAPKFIEATDSHECTGVLSCRFQNNSAEVRALGRFFKSQQGQDFQPYFVIAERHPELLEDVRQDRIEVTPAMIDTMCDRATFDIGRVITVTISSIHVPTVILIALYSTYERCEKFYEISGFPRNMITENISKSLMPGLDKTPQNLRNPNLQRQHTHSTEEFVKPNPRSSSGASRTSTGTITPTIDRAFAVRTSTRPKSSIDASATGKPTSPPVSIGSTTVQASTSSTVDVHASEDEVSDSTGEEVIYEGKETDGTEESGGQVSTDDDSEI